MFWTSIPPCCLLLLQYMRSYKDQVPSREGRAYFACRAYFGRFVSIMAAPPTLKRQFGMSMLRWFPKYQFWVMFSVETTSTLKFLYVCRNKQTSEVDKVNWLSIRTITWPCQGCSLCFIVAQWQTQHNTWRRQCTNKKNVFKNIGQLISRKQCW